MISFTKSVIASIPCVFGRASILTILNLCLAVSCTSVVCAQDAAEHADKTARIRQAALSVDTEFVRMNAKHTRDWPAHGLDHAETRFSKLNQIDTANVNELGLLWSYDLESVRGVEATPIVVDGVMYVSAAWSVVHAIDVRTGKRLWSHDPKVERSDMYTGCCDAVNRGVAIYKGKVFVGAFDGRLLALDAVTGEKVWEKDTILDRTRSYTITGAPRIVKGNVVIGNGGGEYAARGYVTAYDAESGAQKWRWFTVPGNPDEPFENDAMAMAAKTWDATAKWWETGGGGTVWDSMTFDPELNLLYIGTDNGVPWARSKRSPAGGDNLFLVSIVALDADTGEYVWHYQVMPADNSDYSAAQQMTLADLEIDGKLRKVLMQAPKNGYFVVVDRTNGEFISAENYTEVNWATGYDENGRPIETPLYAAGDKPREILPTIFGGHSWKSMSFNPSTGLVYLPVQGIPLTLMDNKKWTPNKVEADDPHSNIGWNIASLPNAVPPTSKPFGRLIAWDPVAQKEVWRYEHVSPWNGGTLATAGALVFQGTADARILAFDANSGEKLWGAPTGTGVVAAPVTYEVDGKQFVTIAAGWGGVYGLAHRHSDRMGPGTVYTFVLGGNAKPPEFVIKQQGALVGGVEYDPADVEAGKSLYVSNCVFCHGVPGVDRGGNVPNLGYLNSAFIANLEAFLFKGPAMSRGMPDFTGKLTNADVNKIKAFILGTADAVRSSQ